VKWHDGIRTRFTALLHQVSLERLWVAYGDLSPKAAPGVDGVRWEDYGQDLAGNLRDLHDRVHSGRCQARPSRRAYIPKADGRLRPLGIAAREDKIVPRAVVGVLNAVCEVDFLGLSSGFRPGRGPHDALGALAAGIYQKKVNWVLDADIRGFSPAWIRAGRKGSPGTGSRTSGSCAWSASGWAQGSGLPARRFAAARRHLGSAGMQAGHRESEPGISLRP
jgi:hypothetical protein